MLKYITFSCHFERFSHDFAYNFVKIQEKVGKIERTAFLGSKNGLLRFKEGRSLSLRRALTHCKNTMDAIRLRIVDNKSLRRMLRIMHWGRRLAGHMAQVLSFTGTTSYTSFTTYPMRDIPTPCAYGQSSTHNEMLTCQPPQKKRTIICAEKMRRNILKG